MSYDIKEGKERNKYLSDQLEKKKRENEELAYRGVKDIEEKVKKYKEKSKKSPYKRRSKLEDDADDILDWYKGTKNILGIGGVLVLILSIFFLSSNITGSIIGYSSQSISNWIGGALFVLGLVGVFFYLR